VRQTGKTAAAAAGSRGFSAESAPWRVAERRHRSQDRLDGRRGQNALVSQTTTKRRRVSSAPSIAQPALSVVRLLEISDPRTRAATSNNLVWVAGFGGIPTHYEIDCRW